VPRSASTQKDYGRLPFFVSLVFSINLQNQYWNLCTYSLSLGLKLIADIAENRKITVNLAEG